MKIIAYFLYISPFDNKFSIQKSNVEFIFHKSLYLQYATHRGKCQVMPGQWNNLTIYELNDLHWLIAEEGKFTDEQIQNALVRFHKKNIIDQINELKDQWRKIK